MVWIIYGGHMIPGDECGLNFIISALQFKNPGINLKQEIDSIGDRTRTRCVRSNEVTLPEYYEKCTPKS